MSQYRKIRAIADALVTVFEDRGARIVDHDGVFFALFFDAKFSEPMPLAEINIDRLAADIERRLS